MDDIEEFTYQEATVDKEGRGSKDIMHRLQKARDAFLRLRRVWAARGIGKENQDKYIEDLSLNKRLQGGQGCVAGDKARESSWSR